MPFLSVLLRRTQRLTTIENCTVLPSNTDKTTNPVILRQRTKTQLAALQRKVSGTLAKQQVRYKRYFDKKVGNLPAFTAGQMVHVNRPPLATHTADL